MNCRPTKAPFRTRRSRWDIVTFSKSIEQFVEVVLLVDARRPRSCKGLCSSTNAVNRATFNLYLRASLNFYVHTFRPAVLNLFRLADHLTNFASVRGPPKNCRTFHLHKIQKSS